MESYNETSDQSRAPWLQSLKKLSTSPSAVVIFFLSFFFLGAAFLYSSWNPVSKFIYIGFSYILEKEVHIHMFYRSGSIPVPQSIILDLRTTKSAIRFNCTTQGNQTQAYNLTSSPITCPTYFRWIHEDLKPWKEAGITREMIERGRPITHFRLVIVEGKAYVEKYIDSFQTRDTFTLWGILQLLNLYPGKLPDLELMFNTWDGPAIRLTDFPDPNVHPPPMFGYCGANWSSDILFPDWSFWGWAEVNIKPWRKVLQDIKEGNKRIKWKDRVPYAFWKGSPHVDPNREDLLKCKVTKKHDWNTRLFALNWRKQKRQGYKHSRLEDQCTYRYKIYIEGRGWSVSEKYILACDSMTVYVKPQFFDFYIRGMIPLQHYWPIRNESKCTSLKFAVEWGNNHTDEVQNIGKAGSDFIQEELKMEHVYEYMFHVLNEYAKLLRFKPTIPAGAIELCDDKMMHGARDTAKKFMLDSMESSHSHTMPCSLPPYDPLPIQHLLDRKGETTRQVENWEDEYWRERKS